MIKRSTIDSVIEIARIEEVVGDYVQLKRRGANLIGLCPFHTEKSPSFSVSPTKGIFKCFGCGVAGDSIGFLIDHDKLSYPEAIRALANKYNIPIEEDLTIEQQDANRTEQNERESLYILNDFAKETFFNQLVETEEGKSIGLSYFIERGLSQPIIELFGLGYSFDSKDGFSQFALKKGYKENVLETSGLSIKNEYGFFDRFKGRVMFPIFSVAGKVLGFGGRTLKSDNKKEAKYVNSPESIIYHKSQTLYGLFQAKKSVREKDKVYLTEGYLDVIGLYEAGITNAVASSGTSLTVEQCKLIRRFTDNVTIVYDSDNAGQEATERAISLLLQADLNVKIIQLPDGDDPDSFRKKNSVTALLAFFEENEVDFLDFLFERKLSLNEGDAIGKSNAIKEILETIAVISDPIKRGLFVSKAANFSKVDEQLLINETNKQRVKKYAKGEEKDWIENKTAILKPEVKTPLFSDVYQEKDLLRLLLLFGNRRFNEEFSVSEYVFSIFDEVVWEDQLSEKLYKACLQYRNTETGIELKTFLHFPDREVSAYAIDLSLPRDISENWEKMHDIFILDPDENYVNDVESGCDRLKFKKIQKLKKEIQSELKKKLSDEEVDHMLEIHMQLEKETIALSKKYGITIVE